MSNDDAFFINFGTFLTPFDEEVDIAIFHLYFFAVCSKDLENI